MISVDELVVYLGGVNEHMGRHIDHFMLLIDNII